MRIDNPTGQLAALTGSFSGSFTGVGNLTGVTADSVEYANVNNKPTLVSGSVQIDITQTTGYSSFSSSIASDIAGLDGEYATDAELLAVSGALAADIASNEGRLDTLEGKTLFSGSSQVVLNDADKTGFDTADVAEGTNLYYTDTRVKTKLNTESVVSGSSQILTLVSIDEDTMTSNSDTKLPTQQSVKTYVDNKVSALVDSAPGALDTLNELAAALGDDANFSTTVSNTIAGKVSQSLEIISGNGLTGGGNLTTNRTLAVGGTTDRISVSADAVDIASTYVGQSSITTLGTIGTGTWQGSSISTTYTDAKVTSIVAGTGISINSGTGAVTVTNTITNNNQLTNGAGYTTYSANQGLDNDDNVHFEGLMVGQTTGATANTIRCVGDVVAYYSSDAQFKDNVVKLEGALDKVKQIRGVEFDWNDKQDVYEGHDIGVIAQEVQAVYPELVHHREHSDSLAVDYVKLTAVLIEAVKELSAKVDELSK
jgi:hypothetical protein